MGQGDDQSSLSPAGTEAAWTGRLLWWLILWLAIRLAYIAFGPLELVPDEAYYWDWSRRLAWGYFSKPPLIAWLIALSTAVLGTSAFTVRLPAALLTTAAIWIVFAWVRRLFEARTAFWAAVTLSLTPAAVVVGLFMTTDSLLLFFWCLALYLLTRILSAEDKAVAWWLLLGLAVGAGFLGKQTMLAFPMLTGALLLIHPGWRRHLRGPGPYLALGLGLLMAAPLLWWNQQHHWVTFWHTAHYFKPTLRGLSLDPAALALFVGGQLLIISPLLWLLLVAVNGRLSWPRPGEREGRVLMLLVFGLWPLLGVLGLSFFQAIHANWPVAFYPAAMVPVAAWAGGRVSAGPRLDRRRGWFWPALAVGAIFVLVTFSLPFILRLPVFEGSRLDTTARMRGWRQLGLSVEKVLAGLPARPRTFLLTFRRQEAAELAFYVPGRPRVYIWPSTTGRIDSQYRLWPGPRDMAGGDALLIWPWPRPVPPGLVRSFRSFRRLTFIHRPGQRPGWGKYAVYLARGLIAWPRGSVPTYFKKATTGLQGRQLAGRQYQLIIAVVMRLF